MPSPTPRGILPPAVDAVPVPEFIAADKTALAIEAGGGKQAKWTVKRPGKPDKKKKDVEVSAAAYIYAMGYRRGWTDSAAHYFIEEEIAEGESH